jgi:glutaminyl-tRNA synthetase
LERASPPRRTDFIRAIVADDLEAGTHGGRVATRFPPEPNGFLHIGHAKSIVLNFGIARETGGVCHLRFDDTNPETEEERYVRAITDDVRWLGFEPGPHIYHAADYFGEMYALAEFLIEEGQAYVDSSSEEEVRVSRGTVTEPGRPTPYRDRDPAESLDLFRRMRAGEFPNGAHVVRGRIDLASKNMLLRDPVLYRIRHATHYRTGDAWCVYPLYDFAHPVEDAIECITHSICTLEFENNRALYDWVVEGWIRMQATRGAEACQPRQYEFARLNLDYTVMSKRKLLELVNGGQVSGWDDPRMPTIAGLRRRGVPPHAIRTFCEMVGVAKTENRIDIGKLEFATRDYLNQEARRVLCVVRPLRIVLENFPEGETEWLEAPFYPHDVPKEGSRRLAFSRTLLIDRDDFAEDPPRGWRRLAPGWEVRLRYGYLVTCREVIRDDQGQVVELRCTYDPETRGGHAPDGRSVRGTIHWVSEQHSVPCQVRLYDRLFRVPDPDAGDQDFKSFLNPDSLVVEEGARIEPAVQEDPPGTHYQFERQGYFFSDPVESRPDRLVFNRVVTLRDTWAKLASRTTSPGTDPGEAGSPRPAPAGDRENRPAPAPTPGAAPTPPPRTPELEAERRRLVGELGVAEEEAEVLTRESAHVALFGAALAAGGSPRGVANWVIHELPREVGGRTLENLPFSGRDLGELVRLVEEGVVSSSGGREILAAMVQEGGPPAELVDRLGLRQRSDPDELRPVVERIIAANPDKAAAFRAGRTGLLGFFMGQVMRETGGSANPEVVRQLVERALTS